MKYLADYTEESISKTIKDNGGFFAFGQKQFDKAKKEGVKYVNLYGGLVCPEENAKNLLNGIENAHNEGVRQDLKDHTHKQIIWRELANHETQFDGELQNVYDALLSYPFTKDQIDSEYSDYYKHCCEKDLF